MNPPENQARAIFLQAIEQPDAAARASFIAHACGGDADLQARVERLVRSHEQLGSFHEDSPPPVATLDQPPAECIGMQIGPYKLIEQIGEGGMGVVYMAQQSEPVKRLVALKLIKAGMDSRQVIARFEAERQALALMDHPNIAKVLDAGTVGEPDALARDSAPSLAHASGYLARPYFVMELVRGVPITAYCDEHRLTPRQRLELFIPVCQAIQHAHQKGIIHRDLKPSNVLVALYDGKPVPKVIDFGVAKAAGQPLTEQTLVTGFGSIVGTLEYMSPEQAEINQLDIDTRSDIYSLGVLLYELLTGSPPFSRKELEQAGMLEMLRVIREQEPSKPSTKLSSSEALPSLSASRGTDPAKLTKLVRGELDWIVMKALEKDRNRRYETANGFAMDVQRYLADEAVLACPPSVGYRLRKFARRNRRAVLTGSAATFVVVLAVAGLVVGSLLFQRERARAATERAELVAEANQRLEAQLYRQRIALAEREWFANNLSRMEDLLEQCPAELRDWEWYYLKRLRHSVQSPLRHEGPVLDATFSPGGQHLATSTQGGIVRIWHAETGQKVLEWQAHKGNVPTIRFCPDGRYLATGSWDNSVKVWDLEQVGKQIGRREVAKPLHRWEHTASRVWSVAFSPDGRRLASAGGKELGKTGEVNVWNLETGQKVFPTQTFPWAVRGVQFSPDGRRLATACNEHVQMWDAQTGPEQVLRFPCRDRHGHLDEVAFSPDGRQIAAVGGHTAVHPDREVHVWNATTGEEVFSLTGHVGGLRGVTFSPDGHRLVSSGLDQNIKVWDAKSGEEILTLRGHLDNVISVAFSLDGCKLATASFDNTVRIWDGTPLEREPTPEFHTLRGHVGAVLDVAFHPRNGNTLVSAGSDGTVREWDLQAGMELVQRQRTKLSQRPRVAYSPDGQRLAVSAALGGVHVWDATIGACPPFADHTAAVGCLTFSPDSRLVASADGDSILLIWDTTTAKKVRALWDDAPAQEVPAPKGQSWPNAIAISPDGRQLVTGSGDGILRVWDLKSPDELPTRRLPQLSRVTDVAFNRDGKRLASASYGRSVKVWDTEKWQILYDLPQPSAVLCVAFDSDGSRLVWGSTDGTVNVWDGPGTEPHVFRGHTSWIQAVKFSPDGEWIASASLDGTVKIWKAPPVAKTPAEVIENPGK